MKTRSASIITALACATLAFARDVALKAHEAATGYMSRMGMIAYGVPRASGIPDYGPAGTINYNPEVYSGKLVEKFYRSTVFGEIASTDYEGDIAGMGSNVLIRTVPDVQVSDYVIGAGLGLQYPGRNSVTLAIDKGKSFSVAVSTVDARQSDLDMADIFANDGSIQLRIAADADMLETIPADVATVNSGTAAGNDSGDLNLGSAAAPRAVSKDNIVDALVDFGQVLDEQSVSDEGRWVVLPPWAISRIKRSDLKIASLTGDGVSILRNGKVGEVDRLTVYQSRSLLSQNSPSAAANYVMFGHPAGLTFAAQIAEMRIIDNPNDFGYLVQGLLVYGFEVIEENYVGCAVLSRG
ncbi:MAG: hypothetical protein KF863_21435 [Rubrivivax sp.]|nr:hypothetical protein [Rubrivivax sp.]